MKTQVTGVLAATGTLDVIGEGNFFVHEDDALIALMQRVDDPTFDAAACTLRPART